MTSLVQEIGVAEVDIGAETETPISAVSWAAIIAGAVVAAAVSLILMVLGSGLGFSIVAPWSNSGVSATTFAVSTIVWLIIIQWVASGVGVISPVASAPAGPVCTPTRSFFATPRTAS